MNIKRISFDFDGTLSKQEVYAVALMLLEDNYTLYIITKRFDYPQKHQKAANEDVKEVARKLRIPKDHLIFTNGLSKSKFIKKHEIILHLDNNLNEISDIDENANCELVYVGLGSSWLRNLFKKLIRYQL